jgi:hypothetical protein
MLIKHFSSNLEMNNYYNIVKKIWRHKLLQKNLL